MLSNLVSEKTLESALDSKEIKPVNLKENQPWIFIAWTDAEAPILWLPDAKSQLTGKDPVAGKDWEQEEKGMTEEEMAGWHHRLDGREFEWTPGVGDGQEGLACCDSWGHKESDMTEWLNWLTDRLTNLGSSSFSVLSFCLFILFMGFSRQEYWSGLPFPSPVDHVLLNSPPWPVHLGWPYMAWLIVSLS